MQCPRNPRLASQCEVIYEIPVWRLAYGMVVRQTDALRAEEIFIHHNTKSRKAPSEILSDVRCQCASSGFGIVLNIQRRVTSSVMAIKRDGEGGNGCVH